MSEQECKRVVQKEIVGIFGRSVWTSWLNTDGIGGGVDWGLDKLPFVGQLWQLREKEVVVKVVGGSGEREPVVDTGGFSGRGFWPEGGVEKGDSEFITWRCRRTGDIGMGRPFRIEACGQLQLPMLQIVWREVGTEDLYECLGLWDTKEVIVEKRVDTVLMGYVAETLP